jgi:arsenate reductase-like glutaredoxin family protein
LLSLGAQLQERDLGKAPLSEVELEALIGDADIAGFLNTRTALYRERKMKANPPTRAEAITLMAQDSNLIKRPIVVKGRTKIVGGDQRQLRALVEEEHRSPPDS